MVNLPRRKKKEVLPGALEKAPTRTGSERSAKVEKKKKGKKKRGKRNQETKGGRGGLLSCELAWTAEKEAKTRDTPPTHTKARAGENHTLHHAL